MSAYSNFRSPTSSDAEILDALDIIAKELEQDMDDSQVSVVIMDGYGSDFIFSLSEIRQQPFVEHANQHHTASWKSVSIHFRPLELSTTILRDREQGDDEIKIRFQRDPVNPVGVSHPLTAIQRQFAPVNRAAAIEKALGPEMAEFYRRREEGLARLENLTQKLIVETHEYRIHLDSDVVEHKRLITASFDDNQQALEARYKERTAAVESREQDLDKLRKDLDDRSARHARREQSRALQQKISDRSERFTLTKATQRKRWPVHVIFALLIGVSGGLVGESLLFPETGLEGIALWLELGRVPLGALGFALTAIFYIRWNDQWFRQHADQEFKLQQLALDVDRAGYAAEMLLEWQEDKDGQMPAVMVDRLTAGLFVDPTTAGRVRYPTEDVTSALLKASSNVRVDVPGVGEITLSGRQLRRVERDLVKSRE